LLSLRVLAWAKKTRAKVVVIENVAAFLKAPVWGKLRKGFEKLGYRVDANVFDATEFGVPQRRSRSFTIAYRGDCPQINPCGEFKVRTVRQAWLGLPKTPNGENSHYAPRPSKLALARMLLVPPGGDKRDIMRRSRKLCAPSWMRLGIEVTDVWGRMEWEKPSNTLRTCLLNPSKGRYIHPDQHRVISLREAARLHTIPDGWKFIGSPTQVARQIGNSVPPALGRAVARAVMRSLRG
jgi:DNA (cytosine-5)-methyltransferase 1